MLCLLIELPCPQQRPYFIPFSPSSLLFFVALSSGEDSGPGFPSGVVAAVVVIVILTFIAISLVGVLVVCFSRRKATVKKDESRNFTISMPLKMLYFNNCYKYCIICAVYC